MTQKPRSFAVHQPNYLPWLGYFVKMAVSDTFVYLDDVQMPMGRSYVSRVAIKKGNDNQWLTVPVSRHSNDLINAVALVESDWREVHLRTLAAQYKGTPGYSECARLVETIFAAKHSHLADLNMALINAICEKLNIETQRIQSSTLSIKEKSDERIAHIGEKLGAGVYISGTGGNNYQSEDVYRSRGIALEVCKTSGERANALLAPEAHLDRSIVEIMCVMGLAATASVVKTLAVEAILR
jgi:hypothetical protein